MLTNDNYYGARYATQYGNLLYSIAMLGLRVKI